MRIQSRSWSRISVLGFLLVGVMLLGNQCPLGLNHEARQELIDAGVDKYLGEFETR